MHKLCVMYLHLQQTMHSIIFHKILWHFHDYQVAGIVMLYYTVQEPLIPT